MKIPYKQEPNTQEPNTQEPKRFVTFDHEQFITAKPEHVKDLIVKMHMKSESDLAMADIILGRIRKDKKVIEDRYREPVDRAHKAHKKLTTERNDMIENYDWAENLLKDKMKTYNMESDRKALAEAEVTTTSMSRPKPRSELKHTTFIEKWKYRITDITKIPFNYMMPDDKKIAATVRSMGGMAEINGIHIFRDDEVRIKT